MRVAFVGVKRKYLELDTSYVGFFDRFHLELPWYYAVYGGNDVTLTTVDYDEDQREVVSDCGNFRGSIRHVREDRLREQQGFDVVVHWRKWFPELHRPEAVNVIVCQDHSFSPEWKVGVGEASRSGKLHGILCFPEWHERNLVTEMAGFGEVRTLPGMTLGVDPGVYRPSHQKSPYTLLWASDPGRGLEGAVRIAAQLWNIDRRFKLHVYHPDYARANPINHPAVVWHGNVGNGSELFEAFNAAGFLPYTSTFREPSSRAHRQAMAAGALVLYPPNMGTPSDLIQNRVSGIVSQPSEWVRTIVDFVTKDNAGYRDIVRNARDYALSERWEVQARRFNEYFSGVTK